MVYCEENKQLKMINSNSKARQHMMRYVQGNLLDSDAEALVNAVNTVGAMGKGIALMFKNYFPENFERYAAACKAKEVRTGCMFVTERFELIGPRWIVNFPTKEHWRQPTRLEWITEGLKDLRAFVQAHDIRSIAIPRLGCGNGGLDWAVVRPQIEAVLCDLDGVDIQVYGPPTNTR